MNTSAVISHLDVKEHTHSTVLSVIREELNALLYLLARTSLNIYIRAIKAIDNSAINVELSCTPEQYWTVLNSMDLIADNTTTSEEEIPADVE